MTQIKQDEVLLGQMTGKNHQPENDVDIWNCSTSCKLLETTNSSVKPQSTQSAHAHCPILWISHLQATTPQHTPTCPLIHIRPYSQILVLKYSLPAWEITTWHSTHEVWVLWILHLNPGHLGRQIVQTVINTSSLKQRKGWGFFKWQFSNEVISVFETA